jgi:hypothetical protein
MYGQRQDTVTTVADGAHAELRMDSSRRAFVATEAAAPLHTRDSGTMPVGGGITWTKTQVTLTGSSQTILAANANRKGLMVGNPAGNAALGVDISGGTAALDNALPLAAGEKISMIGGSCPVGAITGIGTSTQKITVYEGT